VKDILLETKHSDIEPIEQIDDHFTEKYDHLIKARRLRYPPNFGPGL
jgi:hypothetical protein